MEVFSKCPQLLDLIPKAGDRRVGEKQTRHGFSEEKLELSLGPPCGEWSLGEWSLGCFSNDHRSAGDHAGNTVGTDQKRSAPASVVGWPPIRSFRKNIASGSCPKLCTESSNVGPQKAPGSPKPAENNGPKSLFVKINMEGIPIGRKVDLKMYNSYDKLSYAVDELFRGLLAAQSELNAGGMKDKKGGGKVIDCLLDGSGEYTLVYEDNEGDKMLVGDDPWHIFTSTVKRLRVLKSSELPALSRGSKPGKLSHRA